MNSFGLNLSDIQEISARAEHIDFGQSFLTVKGGSLSLDLKLFDSFDTESFLYQIYEQREKSNRRIFEKVLKESAYFVFEKEDEIVRGLHSLREEQKALISASKTLQQRTNGNIDQRFYGDFFSFLGIVRVAREISENEHQLLRLLIEKEEKFEGLRSTIVLFYREKLETFIFYWKNEDQELFPSISLLETRAFVTLDQSREDDPIYSLKNEVFLRCFSGSLMECKKPAIYSCPYSRLALAFSSNPREFFSFNIFFSELVCLNSLRSLASFAAQEFEVLLEFTDEIPEEIAALLSKQQPNAMINLLGKADNLYGFFKSKNKHISLLTTGDAVLCENWSFLANFLKKTYPITVNEKSPHCLLINLSDQTRDNHYKIFRNLAKKISKTQPGLPSKQEDSKDGISSSKTGSNFLEMEDSRETLDSEARKTETKIQKKFETTAKKPEKNIKKPEEKKSGSLSPTCSSDSDEAPVKKPQKNITKPERKKPGKHIHIPSSSSDSNEEDAQSKDVEKERQVYEAGPQERIIKFPKNIKQEDSNFKFEKLEERGKTKVAMRKGIN